MSDHPEHCEHGVQSIERDEMQALGLEGKGHGVPAEAEGPAQHSPAKIELLRILGSVHADEAQGLAGHRTPLEREAAGAAGPALIAGTTLIGRSSLALATELCVAPPVT